MREFIVAGMILAASPCVALAQGAENGRYSMTPVEGGFLRLDTRTGAVSLCKPSGDAVECRMGASERGALQDEIDRLTKENADLKSRVAAAPPPAAPGRAREEMDRALDAAERFMRRMMRIMREEAPENRT